MTGKNVLFILKRIFAAFFAAELEVGGGQIDVVYVEEVADEVCRIRWRRCVKAHFVLQVEYGVECLEPIEELVLLVVGPRPPDKDARMGLD